MNNISMSSAQITVVSEDEAGQRIDNFLFFRFKGIPKSMIYRLLRKGAVRVNKKRVKPEYKLNIGDKIRFPPVRMVKHKVTTISPKLNRIAHLTEAILYEDDYILVLNKPSGTAVHGGSRLNFGVIEGLRALRHETNFLELVHRLDRETSGILLVAKRRSALRYLHEQLRKREIKKDYLALVYGQWPSHLEMIKVPLLKNILQSGERLVRVSSEGKPCETHFKVEQRYAIATLIKASPITGRTHQIRVHTLYAGHPIAFDTRYGKREFDKLLLPTGLRRLFLHASVLSFIHPSSGNRIRIEAPLDNELIQCLTMLYDSSNELIC